jgi:hypothetical protein
MNWKRGLFRTWLSMTIAWIIFRVWVLWTAADAESCFKRERFYSCYDSGLRIKDWVAHLFGPIPIPPTFHTIEEHPAEQLAWLVGPPIAIFVLGLFLDDSGLCPRLASLEVLQGERKNPGL